MSLDPALRDALAIGGAATGLLALLLVLIALLRLRRMRRAYSVLQGEGGVEPLIETVGRGVREVAALRTEVAAVTAELADIRTDLADAIRHVAVVRYDAFGDMGGRMSFSLALLDDAGDGLVLSSICGRTDTRSYAKGVKGGTSEAPLSPEEEQVVGWAMGVRPPGRGKRS